MSQPTAAADGNVVATVRKMNGQHVGRYEVPGDQPVVVLKGAIEEAGGPAASDQRLIAGHKILEDDELISEALRDFSEALFLVTVEGCPTCKGPCACTLCGCKPQSGLIDYYGVCRECSRCGGHASKCPFCRLSFPSLCALDTHIRFSHQDREVDWQGTRLDAHISKRDEPGSRRAAMPEPGTFLEACRGGLAPRASAF